MLEYLIERCTLDADGCILWIGATARGGYGSMTVKGKRKQVHRYIFELYTGIKLKPTDFICHSCDKPACIKPDHLMLGDDQLNRQDKINKNRQMQGTDQWRSILDKETIALILELSKDGFSGRGIARMLDCSKTVISGILRNKTYKQLTKEVNHGAHISRF